MSAITVARKPLSETSVAANALRWGTGGINIDGCRVGSPPEQVTQGTTKTPTSFGAAKHKQESKPSPLGRWPANLVLQHKQGCRIIGRVLVPSALDDSDVAVVSGDVEVPLWACDDDCPVADVDDQSGMTRSGVRVGGTGESLDATRKAWRFKRAEGGYTDDGGASRFFKQVQTENDVTAPPKDLISYLTTLISPPDQTAIYLGELGTIQWDDVASWKDSSMCGFICRGTPTEEQAKELMRVLMPGAHLLLIAPEEQPTGHTGACRIEDAGFEIRDAILWARDAGRLHYVPKASRSEREEGCGFLEGKSGPEAVDREDGTAGLDNPRAGAGRSADTVKNFHPTVKPVLVMERLLADIPRNQGPVIDPFLGSGTTGIACMRTGHDFIGIEREEEYGVIATMRIKFDNNLHHRERHTVVSEFEVSLEKGSGHGDSKLEMDDLFDFPEE